MRTDNMTARERQQADLESIKKIAEKIEQTLRSSAGFPG